METKRGYHAWSRGMIVNEIVRRVDPKGRTIKEFFHDEVEKPLKIEFNTGSDESIVKRRFETIFSDIEWYKKECQIPLCLGRDSEHNTD